MHAAVPAFRPSCSIALSSNSLVSSMFASTQGYVEFGHYFHTADTIWLHPLTAVRATAKYTRMILVFTTIHPSQRGAIASRPPLRSALWQEEVVYYVSGCGSYLERQCPLMSHYRRHLMMRKYKPNHINPKLPRKDASSSPVTPPAIIPNQR